MLQTVDGTVLVWNPVTVVVPHILGEMGKCYKKYEGVLIWQVIVMKWLNIGKLENKLSNEGWWIWNTQVTLGPVLHLLGVTCPQSQSHLHRWQCIGTIYVNVCLHWNINYEFPKILKGPKILNVADRHVSSSFFAPVFEGNERTTSCYGVPGNSSPLIVNTLSLL